jgi:hypothetical protein
MKGVKIDISSKYGYNQIEISLSDAVRPGGERLARNALRASVTITTDRPVFHETSEQLRRGLFGATRTWRPDREGAEQHVSRMRHEVGKVAGL